MSGVAAVLDIPSLLQQGKLVLRVGPFSTRLKSDLSDMGKGVQRLYGDYPMSADDGGFYDFHIELKSPAGIRRWYRPQVNFYYDGRRPFKPLSQDQAFAMFEWGLNWCITMNAHHYLIVHAAVVEKQGLALIMPGAPGAGKSTLCAGLISRGWRLLSDEMTLIPIQNPAQVVPVPRPVSLKNQSIRVIKDFNPQAVFGNIAFDTAKGTVSHMKPPRASIARSSETARPAFVVFPRYQYDAETSLKSRTKAASYMEMASQSFNYNVLGRTGFDILTELVSQVDCYDFRYSDLDQAIEVMDGLVSEAELVTVHA